MTFDDWTCRASGLSKIMGKMGITENQEATLATLDAKTASGKPLTENQKVAYSLLMTKKLNPELPLTAQTELRAAWRSAKYNRGFQFTNKYVQKGLAQEEEAITVLSNTLERPLFKWKKGRIFGKYLQGMPDVVEHEAGFDTKCAWNLRTFPFPGDDLESDYEWQNQAYMKLCDKEVWYTAKVLVNTTERLLYNEKMKWFYQLGSPDVGTEEFAEYEIQAKEVEKDMIFDYARFQNHYPHHVLLHTPDEWIYDIPVEDRIVFLKSERNEQMIKEAEERVVICRKYLNELSR
jgi:hypothetical protein